MIFLQKFLTNWRAQRGKFLTISLMFRDFSCETLCVDKIISSPRGILWVDKIGSADRGILCVDKIGSPENPQHPCWPLIRWPMDRTKQSPGEDRRVGWYCYRATQSRRSHLTYTHRKSSYRPKENIFWEKKFYYAFSIDFLMELCARSAEIFYYVFPLVSY